MQHLVVKKMSIKSNSLWYFDWISFLLTVSLALIGLLFVFSATYTQEHPYSIFFKKQAAGIAIGLIIYFLFSWIDYRSLMRWGYLAYYGVVGLLLFTLIKGSIGMGAQRWINLFFFKLQPSELAKLLLPSFIAYYFYSHKKINYQTWKDFIPLLCVLFLSCFLILRQPDLGTALIVLFSGLLLLWLAGLPNKFFLIGFILTVLAAPALWYVLKPYQRNRIAVFLGYGTTHKERYQIEQAAIAIGSGGVFGKGIKSGTQNTLQFLPESRTDFIFAVVCEEWGFLGALLILALYAFLFIRLLWQIQFIDSSYIQLLAMGLVTHLILSTIINICMVIGLLPIVGIPLPLMSYGLSNLFISWASLGWLQGIFLHTID